VWVALSLRRPTASAYNRGGTPFAIAGSCTDGEDGMARREGKKAPNGAGSEWYDPGRGLYFAAYTRGLRPDGTAYVKRFASKASQAEANGSASAARRSSPGSRPPGTPGRT
jgi:hypothetical protein